MRGESDSEDDREERRRETEALDSSHERSDAAAGAGHPSAAEVRTGAEDWLASFRDVHFSWSESERARGSPDRSDDEWFLSRGDSSASGTDPDDRAPAASGGATATAAAFDDMPTAGRSRKRVAVVAAAVVLLLAVAAVGAVAVVGRNGGAESSSRTASSRSSTRTSGAAVSTTTAPATTPSTAPVQSTPATFTVHSTCGGRDCSLAVHDVPGRAAKRVGSLRSGDVVQVACSTHGELVADKDTGQQSDVWYRLADRPGYASAAYLQGPTVPDCG
jgi:hypothetical protein